MKEYFSSRGTVSTWWREGKWSDVLNLYYTEQLNYVSSFCEWHGKAVLDAGTGFGRFARALALKGATVSGVDINPDMVEIARSRNKDLKSRLDFQIGDIENLSFKDETFDVVVCIETLMHIPNPLKAVREFARVTRPCGLVFLGINNIFSAVKFVQAMGLHVKFYNRLKHRPKIPKIHHSNRICEIRSWVRNNNLKIRDEIGFGLLHPETNLAIAPGLSINLVPHRVSKTFLYGEKMYGLGRTWLKHVMKAIVVVGEKPEVN